MLYLKSNQSRLYPKSLVLKAVLKFQQRLPDRSLTNSCEKKRSERQRRKGKINPFDAEFQRIARRDKKAFLSDQRKEIEEYNRMGKTRDVFKKIRDTKGTWNDPKAEAPVVWPPHAKS